MHRAWHRRYAPATPQGTGASHRPRARGLTAVLHHLWLDDVELATERAVIGRDPVSVRWQFRIPRSASALAPHRCPERDTFRHQRALYRKLHEASADGAARQPWVDVETAYSAVHRFPAIGEWISLDLRDGEIGCPPGWHLRRYRHRLLLCPRQSQSAGGRWRDPEQGARCGRGGFRR